MTNVSTTKKAIFTAAASIVLASKALAFPVKENRSQQLDYSSSVSDGHTYSQLITSSFITVEEFSAAALVKPIKMTAKCGSDIIGEVALFYDESMSNKRQTLSIQVDDFETKCKDRKPALLLEPNGVLLSFDGNIFESSFFDKGETVRHMVDRITKDRVEKKKQLIEAHSLMSSVAGSKESLYCLIKANEKDDLMEGIVESLKTQYTKSYGDFSSANIDCPAKGILAKEVDQCVAHPGSFTLFCVVYARYLESKKWFTDSIDQLNQRKHLLAEEIDTLVTTLNSDKESSEEQTTTAESSQK